MILMRSVRLAAAVHAYLDAYAPTNILIRRADGNRWAVPIVAGAAACYLAATRSLTHAIEHGAPGWLNVLVLTCAWGTIKLGLATGRAMASGVRR